MQNKFQEHPVSNVQWIHRDKLTANMYNPNHVSPVEMGLLKLSIIEDGWTTAIVITPEFEIVDGFHRWTISKDKDIYKLTDGHIPVIVGNNIKDSAHQIMSTIRHNRARGKHGVLPMANIVHELINTHKVNEEEVKTRLGMDYEEVERLNDRGNMIKRASRDGFNNGWVAEATGRKRHAREKTSKQ